MKVDYLRLSITDRCNLNCIYCKPLGENEVFSHNDILRYEEIAALVKNFIGQGVRKIRVTGGEPLLKRDVSSLVKMIVDIPKVEEVAITTNGVYLQEKAKELKAVGLSRVNVSIDSLKADTYKKITGCDAFSKVWQGIIKAVAVGLNPVKLNVVVMKGINDHEIKDFVDLTLKYPLTVRFIEFFPIHSRLKKLNHCLISTKEIQDVIKQKFNRFRPIPKKVGNGPALYYTVDNAVGSIGFISAETGDFCASCNRLRMDSLGRVYPCVCGPAVADLRKMLRNFAKEEDISQEIAKVLNKKKNYTKNTISVRETEMCSIGG